MVDVTVKDSGEIVAIFCELKNVLSIDLLLSGLMRVHWIFKESKNGIM